MKPSISFTGAVLDRAVAERKDAQWTRARLADPSARGVVASRDAVLVDGQRPPRLTRLELASGTPHEAILLGLEGGQPLFALDADTLTAAPGSDASMVALREAGALLDHPEGGLAAYLVAILNWHRRHRFCANCGAATVVEEAGYSRRCPNCGAHHFPRTDPVVIMTVLDADRLLLGRRVGWPRGRFSVLAGFISPGESAEEAVIREVREESGIVARNPRFIASQPWPFPSSLMLGFDAESAGGEPSAQDGELAEVGWFSLAEVRAAAEERSPDLLLPPPISIARFLIDAWMARQAQTGAG